MSPPTDCPLTLLLRRLGCAAEAAGAYQAALDLEPTAAERCFILRRVGELKRDSGCEPPP